MLVFLYKRNKVSLTELNTGTSVSSELFDFRFGDPIRTSLKSDTNNSRTRRLVDSLFFFKRSTFTQNKFIKRPIVKGVLNVVVNICSVKSATKKKFLEAKN